MSDVEFILALLVAVAALAALADWIRVPYPILMVIGGTALGLAPGLPQIQLPPEIVFLLFVPPLVFAAAFYTSWRDFVANARPILVLAVGLVLASTVLIAIVAHVVVGGIPWAPAFVLGAVVSNTDTTAVEAIAARVGLPRRIVAILEGESLVNDAVALTAFRLAVAATVTGSFSSLSVGSDFALAVLGAVPIGLVVGWLTAEARGHVNDARIVIIIGLLTPYAAYIPANQLGASGILAVVVAGLFVGRREARIENAETRLQAHAVWDLLVFVVNGLLFILVGIQLRPIWNALPTRDLGHIIRAAIIVSLTVILARCGWIAFYVAAPRWLGLSQLAPPPEARWRDFAVVAWAGLRGGDTLAAALSVPLIINGGGSFPARSTILFLAFVVIVVTVVGQGLSLPPLIRWLEVSGDEVEAREETLARRVAAEAAISRLDEIARDSDAPRDLVVALRRRYTHEADVTSVNDDMADSAARHVETHQRLRREVLAAMHEALLQQRDEGEISDDIMRRVERDLDLEAVRFDI